MRVCLNCGTRATPKQITKGSFAMELLLWLLFFPIGIVYSIWRLSTRHDGCPACGSTRIIPVDSPLARQLGLPSR